MSFRIMPNTTIRISDINDRQMEFLRHVKMEFLRHVKLLKGGREFGLQGRYDACGCGRIGIRTCADRGGIFDRRTTIAREAEDIARAHGTSITGRFGQVG